MTPRLRALLPYVLVLAAAVVLSYNALHFGYTPRGERPGPDVWPRAILLLLIVACVVRIVRLLRRPSAAEPVMLQDVISGAMPGEAHDDKPPARYPALLLTGVALTIGYVALLGTLGFFLDTVLYIAALTWTGRYRRSPVIAAVAIAGALVFMFIFMKVVYLSLPIGSEPFATVSLLLMRLLGIR